MLRDYLTDLFPIMEVGTSAKMLSVVPLIAGGGMFETGAGGSAPKHVEQIMAENHLRWDSLGEYLALAASFEHLARTDRQQARADPGRHAGPRDRDLPQREQVAQPPRQPDRQPRQHLLRSAVLGGGAGKADRGRRAGRPSFKALASKLRDDEAKIAEELLSVQGQPVDLGGYYRPDAVKTTEIMRPSKTFNEDLKILAK